MFQCIALFHQQMQCPFIFLLNIVARDILHHSINIYMEIESCFHAGRKEHIKLFVMK